ncbi:MAG TPA: FAD-binding oxidoreductase [Ignavibacteria bacterium]|nr:FAD-binding oxidoreductase [Ignavibacteria bacterium]
MEEHIVRILDKKNLTHNVIRFRYEKPQGYTFIPGQATEVTVNKEGWKDKRNPFTFTCLTTDPFLEFSIKIYPEHKGVTNELSKLEIGDEIILHDVWGAIQYKGKGVFIAGGAGVTPFIAILRDLNVKDEIEGNTLLFANKTSDDIILKDEFEKMKGLNFINILSDEKNSEYDNGHITEEYLKSKINNFNQKFYVCGPPPMVEGVTKSLKNLGAGENAVVVEL